MIILAVVISLFFAMNIGASGTAASMGSAYGGGAIKKRVTALVLVAIFSLLGAVIGGGEVVKTISKGIIPEGVISVQISVIILFSASITLFMANRMGIPLSTSEVIVGSLVGAGLVFKAVLWKPFLIITSAWIIFPFIAGLISLGLDKFITKIPFFQFLSDRKKYQPFLVFLLIGAGSYEAFSAGMNNVANAVGPLVGSGIFSSEQGLWLGGLFVSLGALIWGRKVLETNGKKITRYSLLQASCISITGGTLVIVASLMGIPIPLTQITTMSILGIGYSQKGKSIFQKAIVRQILKTWIISPILSMLISFSLTHIITRSDEIGTSLFFLLVFLSLLLVGWIFKVSMTATNFSKESSNQSIKE
ncbi:inorganic phosphate transporter family protein [Microaerobacter geothermalis]|uniref:inorganic phosphate transporter n=1 Tax=Microaerobacter geothermalis TaxID=674972 RepID=UPI001F257EDD|nr:inorganic phosphate transporter [Microaerobacter geothermalis]MCF6095000.1 inorganic phosphate transporter family protein [Microaerobacter geothermalis]